MNYFVRKQISNHPTLTEVKRYVEVYSFLADANSQYIQLFYKIIYEKDGVDITKSFNPNVPMWVVDNSYRVQILDELGYPIHNPDFPENSDEPYIMEYAFTYFRQLTFDSQEPVRIKDLLEAYITRDDVVNKRFDF